MIRETHVHVAFLLLWVALALSVAIHTALLGNEQAALAKQRGADRTKRMELVYQTDRLRAQLDWRASPPVLAEQVRRLGLAIQPPTTLAAVDRPVAR